MRIGDGGVVGEVMVVEGQGWLKCVRKEWGV